MRDKPIVGVTSGFLKKNDFVEGPYTHQDYITSLIQAGAVPVILPPAAAEAADYLDACDGILLSGGPDVDPKFYNADPSLHIGMFDSERDEAEIHLFKQALAMGKPVLGICRGMQVINAALGGTLVQDIPSEKEHPLQHVQKEPRGRASHRVMLDPGSRIYHLMEDQDTIYVNSLHHQSVDKLGEGLRSVAVSPDGIIEAVEDPTNDRLFAIQWHPESMAVYGNTLMRKLFGAFVDKCRTKKQVVSGS